MTRSEVYEDPGIDLDNFDKEAEIAKFKDVFQAVGWNLFIRLYTVPKKKGSILLAETVRKEDKYKNFVGLVIQQGKGVYTDERYKDTGRWCEVGDWITFPRHSGYRQFIRGIPIWVIKEDAVDSIIEDPRDVAQYVSDE